MLTNRTKHPKPPIALGSTIWYCDTSNIAVWAGRILQAKELHTGWCYNVLSEDGPIVHVKDRNIYRTKEDAERHLKRHVEYRLKYDLEHAKKLQNWLQEQES